MVTVAVPGNSALRVTAVNIDGYSQATPGQQGDNLNTNFPPPTADSAPFDTYNIPVKKTYTAVISGTNRRKDLPHLTDAQRELTLTIEETASRLEVGGGWALRQRSHLVSGQVGR